MEKYSNLGGKMFTPWRKNMAGEGHIGKNG